MKMMRLIVCVSVRIFGESCNLDTRAEREMVRVVQPQKIGIKNRNSNQPKPFKTRMSLQQLESQLRQVHLGTDKENKKIKVRENCIRRD
jgi:hypothetical protein